MVLIRSFVCLLLFGCLCSCLVGLFLLFRWLSVFCLVVCCLTLLVDLFARLVAIVCCVVSCLFVSLVGLFSVWLVVILLFGSLLVFVTSVVFVIL